MADGGDTVLPALSVRHRDDLRAGQWLPGHPRHLRGEHPTVQGGTFVNGFYESWPISYAENAFGFARTGQTIVDVPDATIIKLYVDDEPFTLTTANLLRFERALNMKEGTLDRELVWETPSGKQVQIEAADWCPSNTGTSGRFPTKSRCSTRTRRYSSRPN